MAPPANNTSCPLTIRLFGPFDVRVNGILLPRLRSRKGQWLFALLALRHGCEVERDWLAATLWPDSRPAHAFASLRNSLSDLRRALGPEAGRLRSPTYHSLCLDLEGAAADVVAFDAAIAQGGMPALEQAISLYRGPLLEGCAEEWAFQERQTREQAFLGALEALAANPLVGRDLTMAERHLRRAVAVDPLRETAQRALMRVLASGGNYAAVTQLYRELRLHLHREFNTEPDAETTALYWQLRTEARRAVTLTAGTTREAVEGTADSGQPNRGHLSDSDFDGPVTAAGRLPSGTLTFLFTDIASSTRRWEEQPDAMRAALARHDALLRHAIEAHDGTVFKTWGDQFCAAFVTAPDALTAALAAQCALQAEPWDETGLLSVRMALHTGAVEERDGDYFGPVLNRVARLLEVGHGDQILLSLAAQELARDHLPEGASLRDLGEHRLKDLTRPERVFQLLAPNLTVDFPPLNSLDRHRHNLPAPGTPLIGRDTEVAAVRALLQREDVRLATLSGPGGTGKTRLALQVAAELVDDFADGVCFVALAPIRDPALVASAIAHALTVQETAGRSLLDSLKEYLRERQLLLLLDNFEQVVEAAPLITELLAAALRLKVLVTSRAVLKLQGEHDFPVPPLPLPDPRRLPQDPTELISTLSQYAAVELFIQRAIAARPDFAVTNENAPSVAEICARLDGLPLAIELAAARIRLLTPQAMLPRLGSRLKLLTGGARDLPARQQTLRDTIGWSYDLLNKEEQRLFRRLSIFLGGFMLEAAEAIGDDCGLEMEPSAIRNEDVLDQLESLVGQSLLERKEVDGQLRFGMLETIREFGLECLQVSGEAEAIRQQHAQFFLALAEAAEAEIKGARHREWVERLEAEHDNLRAALAWSQTPSGEAALGLRLAGALDMFWYGRGYLAEGQDWLERALAMTEALGKTTARAKGYCTWGRLAWRKGEYALSRSRLEESVAIGRETGDRRVLAFALVCLGLAVHSQGDTAAARSLQEEGMRIFREEGDRWGLALSLFLLGMNASNEGDWSRAQALYQESVTLHRETGDRWSAAVPLAALGHVAWEQNDVETAQARFEEALAIKREVGDRWQMAQITCGLGKMATHRGDLVQAAALLEESLGLYRDIGYRSGVGWAMQSLALLARQRGEYEAARAWFEQCLTTQRELNDPGGIAGTLTSMGYLAYLQDDPEAARSLLEESLAIPRDPGDRFARCWTLAHLGELADAQGDPEAAHDLLQECITMWRERDDRWAVAFTLEKLGRVALHQGDRQQAAALFGDSLTQWLKLAARAEIPRCLEGLAAVAAQDEPGRAARLFGAAEALREAMGTPLAPVERPDCDRHVVALRATLGDIPCAAAWAEGRAMSLEQAISLALEVSPG